MGFNVIFIIEEFQIFIIVFPVPAVTFGVDPLGRSSFSSIILFGIGNMGLIRRGLVILDHVHLSISIWVSVIAYTDGVDREVLFITSGSSLLPFLIRGSYF
jgi:hypothetical protein